MPERSPAETLRAAASLMRERARLVPPSPWQPWVHDITAGGDGLNVVASSGLTVRAQYIASWHPAVALAVADWLDAEAEHAERPGSFALHSLSPGPLAVARTYLGETDA
jgi:hypothetical protein